MAQRTACRTPHSPACQAAPASLEPLNLLEVRLGSGRSPAGPCCVSFLPQEGVRGAINGPGVRTWFSSLGCPLLLTPRPNVGASARRWLLQPQVGTGAAAGEGFGFRQAGLTRGCVSRGEAGPRAVAWLGWAMGRAGGQSWAPRFVCEEGVWTQRRVSVSPHLVYLPLSCAWVSVLAAISITSCSGRLQKCGWVSCSPWPVSGNVLYNKHPDFGVIACSGSPVCVGVFCHVQLCSSGELSTAEGLLYSETDMFISNDIS